jgi:hypothetical protein
MADFRQSHLEWDFDRPWAKPMIIALAKNFFRLSAFTPT